MEKYPLSETQHREDMLIYSGLLGIAVIAVVQLLGAPAIDRSLTVSLYAFAVAVPMLAVSIYGLTVELGYKYAVMPAYMEIAHFGGALAAITGTAGIFWHFSRLIGLTFLSISVLAVIFAWKNDEALKEANASEGKK